MHPGFYNGIKCKHREKNFVPAPHQLYVRDYFVKSEYKGLYLYHKLGSGKSCTSIIVADEMLKNLKRVFVLTPGSLRKNWLSEYCNVCGTLETDDRFTFITYNYNIQLHLGKYDFNDSLVIIDEVHNLLNGYKNKSPNATLLYNKIMTSRCRVLALSGTPIIQDDIASEWTDIYKLLTGKNEIYSDVEKIPDEELRGIISYYPGDPSNFPRVHVKFELVPMTITQFESFDKAYEKEKKVIVKGPPNPRLFHTNRIKYEYLKKEFIKATKFIVSRTISNCNYGSLKLVDLKADSESESEDSESGDSEELGSELGRAPASESEESEDSEPEMERPKRLKHLPDLLVKDGGWVSTENLKNNFLSTFSPKFKTILLNISRHFNSKHVIYSFFKTRSGVQLLHSLLTNCGITAEIYSGDVNVKKREEILNRFNSKENRNGKKLKVLLVTSAGAEGISILECNNIHIIESDTRENKTRQAIGRVIRYKSHSSLPPSEQYVNVWRYWSVVPEGLKDDKLVDESLYRKGLKSENNTYEFIQRLIANSIENS